MMKINKILKRDIDFIISHSKFLVEYQIKIKISQLLLKYGHEKDSCKKQN